MEKIKELAIKSLYEKWFLLKGYDWDEWTNSCAFCNDCETHCSKCLIYDLPICSAVENCLYMEDKSPIIEALEDLALFGKLLPETEEKLELLVNG